MRRAFLAALLFASTAANASITGTLIDPAGTPIGGATVRAYALESSRETASRIVKGRDREALATVQSGPAGEFSIARPGAPVVEILVTAPGRMPVYFTAADGDDTGALLLPPAKVRRVRLVSGGKPLAQAFVEIPHIFFGRSGEDGVLDLPVMQQRMFVFHGDTAPAIIAVPERDGDVAVDSGIPLSGRVVAQDGKTPVAGASILIDSWPLAQSGADGSFAIAHAPRNWRSVTATTRDALAVASPDGRDLTLRLRSGATFSGVLRDAKSRAPVAGMMIVANGAAAVTDASGSFAIAPLLPGRATVTGSHPAYQLDERGPVDIPVAGLKQALLAQPLAIAGGTVSDEDGKAVGGAVIVGASATGTALVASARNGGFSFRVRGAARLLTYDVQKDGYASASFTVPRGESKRGIAVRLLRGAPLVIRVVDTANAPVAGATVSVTEARDASPEVMTPMRPLRCGGGECTTAENGTVSMRVVPARYALMISGADVVTKRVAPQAVDARGATISVDVEHGFEISGRVAYADAKPPGSFVRVTAEAPPPALPVSVSVEPDGTFVLRGLPRTPVTLHAQMFAAGGLRGASQRVTPPQSNVTLTLPRGGRITGRVLDAVSGSAVTGATVDTAPGGPASAIGQQASSADDGSFEIDSVRPGHADVEATAPGYTRGRSNGVQVTEGETTTGVEIRLDRAGSVKGRVTAADGQPVSGASVRLVEMMRSTAGSGIASATDANGEYELASVPPGERNLAFTKEGFVSVTKSVEAAAGKQARLDVVLDRGRELRGRVVDDAGQPVAGAQVRAEGQPVAAVMTESDGSFRVSGLADTHLRLVARKTGYTDARSDDLDPAAAQAVTLMLGRGATVSGRVVGLADAELAVTSVGFFSSAGYAATRPDTGGNFTFTGVPNGRITFEASVAAAEGARRTARQTVEVANGSAPAVELTFGNGYTIHGRVNAPGQLVEGFMVTFAPVNTPLGPGNGRLDAEGNYAVTGLAAGDYRVMLFAPGVGTLYTARYTVNGDSAYDIDLPSASLRGSVRDTNGTPLPDARVVAMPVKSGLGMASRNGVTDSNGRYALEFVAEGEWRVNVQKEKYQPASRQVTASPSMADVDFQLAPATASSVRVVTARDGSPVVATVSASAKGVAGAQAMTRASDGLAELWLAPGHYEVSVYAPRFAVSRTAIEVPGPEARVALSRGGSIVMIAKPGSPVVVNGPGYRMGTSAGHLDNVPPGTYSVSLMGPDGKPLVTKSITVIDEQTVTVTLE